MTPPSLRPRTGLLVGLPLLLAGCVGSDYTLFFTKESLGVTIDSVPTPNFSVDYKRIEGVMPPVFEDGKTANNVASSSHDIGTILPLSWAHGAVFAGGPPARIAVAQTPNANDVDTKVACLSMRPTGYDGKPLPEKGTSRPMVFSTGTSVGFNVALPATAATGLAFPEAHLGYRRTEVAVAPMLGRPDGCNDNGATYAVTSPGFFAAIRSGASLSNDAGTTPTATTLQGGSFGVGSLFATGDAASAVAALPGVHDAVVKAMEQKTKSAVDEKIIVTNAPDANTACLDAYVGDDKVRINGVVNEATDWAKANKKPAPGDYGALRSSADNAAARAAVVKNHAADMKNLPACKTA